MIYKEFIRAITLIVAVIMMIGVCGCMNIGGKKNRFSVDEILQYMNQKYDENFIYVEPKDADQPKAYSLSIFLKNEKYPERLILAECRLTDVNGEKSFSDNYYSVKYEEQTRELFTQISKNVFPNSKTRYIVERNVSTSNDKESVNSFEDYLSLESSFLSFTVLVEPEHKLDTKEQELQSLCDLLKQKKIVCSVKIVYSNDNEQFETFSCDEYKELSNNYEAIGMAIIGDDFEVTKIEWR